MARPVKSSRIPNLRESIKDAAWRQIGVSGASSLSLRSIARELNISAPAIYNYFQDRDALVTALVIDAYLSFGDSQHAAKEKYPGEGELLKRFTGTGIAYRDWALLYPHRYLLIFGTPVPGYVPPQDEVLPAMMRSMGALADVIAELHREGRLKAADIPRFDPGACFFPAGMFPGPDGLLVYSVAMLIWGRVHGLVSLEVTGKLPPFGPDGDALYRYELEAMLREFVVMD
ncbi:MAG: TetR/AcrR family transcriptional regulator [Chlorobiaceae bacterium]|nr:TetR/AcrR family transcriptional regulator [Chlorobiaceae bacterium]